jgi:hypothetical protein
VPLIGGVDISPVLVLIAFQLILMLPVSWLESQTGKLVARAFCSENQRADPVFRRPKPAVSPLLAPRFPISSLSGGRPRP